MKAPLFTAIHPLKPHFEHGHFTLAQSIQSLKIGLALNSLSSGCKLVNSKYQTPENCKFYLAAPWDSGSCLLHVRGVQTQSFCNRSHSL